MFAALLCLLVVLSVMVVETDIPVARAVKRCFHHSGRCTRIEGDGLSKCKYAVIYCDILSQFDFLGCVGG